MTASTWAPAVDAAVAENISKPGALLPILHAVQQMFDRFEAFHVYIQFVMQLHIFFQVG